jgi:hypothetical protein
MMQRKTPGNGPRASVLQLAGEGGKSSRTPPIPQFPIIATHLGFPA